MTSQEWELGKFLKVIWLIIKLIRLLHGNFHYLTDWPHTAVVHYRMGKSASSLQVQSIELPYLPTPPLGQDMTQGQFFKWSLTGLNSEFFLLLDLLPHQAWRTQSALLFTHSWRENNWIHTFPKGINTMWNAINLVQELNSCRRVQFLRYRVKTVNALLKKSFLIILALWGGPPNFLMFGKYDTTSQLWSLQSVQLYF